MSRFATHAAFQKTLRNLRRLHDVTIQAFGEMFERGREALKDPARRDEHVEIKTGKRKINYRLDVLTDQARDVYPHILRPILLIRLVSAFEAFIVDTVEEVATRDLSPFMNSQKLDLTISHLFKLHNENGLARHLIRRTRRQLTNASIGDVKDFYKKTFNVDIMLPGGSFEIVDEIYDRRHLYVHNEGYVDEQYFHKYPKTTLKADRKAPVDEDYLMTAIDTLEKVASHVINQLRPKYPSLKWESQSGQLSIPGLPDRVFHIEFVPADPSQAGPLMDQNQIITPKHTLGSITLWHGTNSKTCRMVIGGSMQIVNHYLRTLHQLRKTGAIRKMHVVKVVR